MYPQAPNFILPRAKCIIQAQERHQYLAKLIFFYSYMLLWFYIYSVSSFAFYIFLQPKCNRKLSFFIAHYHIYTSDKYRLLSSKQSLFYKASEIYRLLLSFANDKRIQTIKTLINNKTHPSITTIIMSSIMTFCKSYLMT